MRARVLVLIAVAVLVVALVVWSIRSPQSAEAPAVGNASSSAVSSSNSAPGARTTFDTAPTNVYSHNLMLRKGPSFRVYVRWLGGEMRRAKRDVNPSFDDPDSFYLNIKTGVLRANVGDINNFLNSGAIPHSPLTNIQLSGDGDQIKLRATFHKLFPLPLEVRATLSSVPDGRIRLHVTKINVLKIPLKGLLGGFHVDVADLFHPNGIAGVEVSGNDIVFDTLKLLPPPHIRGELTLAHIVNPDLELIYGNAAKDVSRVEQWRNFLRLSDGTIDFGKLTMHHVDLIMVDISKDPWFDLDLTNYQAQLVNGYTRMTPQAGLQIFMPDRRDIPASKAPQDMRIEWLKNRNLPPPADVIKH